MFLSATLRRRVRNGAFGDRADTDSDRSLEAHDSRHGDILILLHTVAAHAQPSYQLPTLVNWHAARELDNPVLAAITVADVPKGALVLRQGANRASRQRVRVTAEGHCGKGLSLGDGDASV